MKFFDLKIATFSGNLENRMERKTVLGLKATPLSLMQENSEEEDEIDFFESDTLNDQGLMFSVRPLPAIHPELTSNPNIAHKNNSKITSFEEASPLISSFLSSLPDFQIPPVFEGPLYFIPDHVMNEQYSEELDRFAKDPDPNSQFNLDLIDAHINVLAQVSIVKFFKGQDIDFSSFLDDSILNVIDNRITALIHYCMSNGDDHQVTSYHRIHSITEFIKTPSVAPVSSLFPDFTLQKISHDLCKDLISLFPHHPLLPSLIDKFNSTIDPTANELLSLIPDDDEDDDADFSDTFIESIKSVQNKPQPLINIQTISSFNEIVTNPLENCQPSFSNALIITVLAPPSMVTYKQYINDNPILFKDWINSLYTSCIESEKSSPFVLPTSISKRKKQMYRKSEEKFQSMPLTIRLDSDDEDVTLTSENIVQIFSYSGSMNDLQAMFNSIFAPTLFPLNYSVAHLIYSDPKVIYKPRNFIYPSIIDNEYKAHTISDNKTFDEVIEGFKKIVNTHNFNNDENPSQKVKIEKLQIKRDLPNKDTETPPLTVQLIALSDIEFVMHERSPITFDRNSSQPPDPKDSEKQIRGEQLFEIYSHDVFPPYLTFRAATALALNIVDSNSSLAVDFLFEGLYILLYTYPQMLRLDFVRNVILYFAELLEKQDRYYYSSLLFDTFYLSKQSDIKHSNEIALICQKNSDTVRAVFYFTQSMKNLVNEGKTDEALYLAQVLSAIYDEYGDNESPISILSYLLKDTYNFSLNSCKTLEIPNRTSNAAVQPRKSPRGNKPPLANAFKPVADQLNTILSGTSLCESLIKTKHFNLGYKLLSSLHASNGNAISNTLISFVENQSYLKRNLFKDFLRNIQEINFKLRRNSPSVKLSFLAAASFDNSLATVRLLIRGYLRRELFRYSLLWSEAYITAQPKMAMKDIGYGFLSRGLSLYQALHHIHAMSPPYSLYAISSNISNKIISYIDENNKDYKSSEDIISESLSSLKAASICLDKVGSQRQLLYSYLLYADLLLMHFFDSEFEKLNSKNMNSSSMTSLTENDNEEDDIKGINTESDGEFEPDNDDLLNDDSKVKPITITEPIMRIRINNLPILNTKTVIFPTITINKSNVVDELRQVFRRIYIIATKCMHPIYIIYYQALSSKLLFLQKKIEASKATFDYAFSNLKKFFFVGDEIVCQDLNLQTMTLLRTTLSNMCITLLFYDKNFINDRLVIFDWLRNIHAIYQHHLRVVTEDSKEPLESNLDVSISSLLRMNFSDFSSTLQKAGYDLSKLTKYSGPYTFTEIPKCLACINANIRLFETGKMPESEMNSNNRALCKLIEQIHDDYRRSNEFNMPIDITYSYVSKLVPLVQSIVFLQHINDSIYAYRPSDGLKKRILLTSYSHTEKESIEKTTTTYITNRSDSSVFSTNSSNNSASGSRTTSTSSISSYFSNSSFSSTPCDLSNYSNINVFKGTTISTMTNKGEITYNSTSSLFSPKFIELVALFLMCDKKQRHDQFNSRLAREIFTKSKVTLFGNSLDDLPVWQKVPDKHFFGENRIFGKGLKGAFCSVKTGSPSIFILSADLNALPLELMFPNILLLRTRSYTRFISKPVDKQEILSKPPRVTICRIKQNPYHMMKVAIRRSKDITSEFISAIGGDIPQLQNVFDNDRSLFFPFSLFSSNNSNFYYTDRFTFCDIIELSSESSIEANMQIIINSDFKATTENQVQNTAQVANKSVNINSSQNANQNANKNSNPNTAPNNKNTTQNTNSNSNKNSNPNTAQGSKSSNKTDKCKDNGNDNKNTKNYSKYSIFIFTYSDLAEMPLILEKLMNKYPYAYCMFIPAQFVREAFQQMVMIFERHQRRIKFVEDHPDDISLAPHKDICNNVFDFVTLLQQTLMQILDCPIPLFVPTQ